MGAGKTTVGRALAARLNRKFFDTDRLIELRTGVSITTIFEIEGEAGFRKRETAVLMECQQECEAVIATGGGIVLEAKNRAHLKSNNDFVIYLDVPVELIYQRIKRDKKRPLLQVSDPFGQLQKLRTERDSLYREVADLVIDGKVFNAHATLQYLLKVLS